MIDNSGMATLAFPPATYEVEDQLKRMLASPRFSNAPNPSAFLKLTVLRALAGKKTRGQTIAKALFEGKIYAGLSSDVRTTASNLRKTLKRYYENEGSSDVVIIEFPEPPKDKTIKPVEGEAYTPRFRYNPSHEPFILLRVGYRLLANQTYQDFHRALNLFTDILEKNSEDICGLIGLAETFCHFGARDWVPDLTQWRMAEELLPKMDWLFKSPQQIAVAKMSLPDMCDRIFIRLEPRANNNWRFWAARANYSENTDKIVALNYYEMALKLDRRSTESFVPYIDFLIGSGRIKEALGLAQRYMNERVEDSLAVGEYGRLLCYAGRQDTGVGHLQAALMLDPGNCSAHQTMAVVRFMQKDLTSLASHLRALHYLCDADSFSRIVAFLKKHEQEHGLDGSVENLLLEMPSAAAALAKF